MPATSHRNETFEDGALQYRAPGGNLSYKKFAHVLHRELVQFRPGIELDFGDVAVFHVLILVVSVVDLFPIPFPTMTALSRRRPNPRTIRRCADRDPERSADSAAGWRAGSAGPPAANARPSQVATGGPVARRGGPVARRGENV